MNKYKVLNNQVYSSGSFSLVPIRFEDRLDIMNWRNEQLYHLRQLELLKPNDQEIYFEKVISLLFNQEKPSQILFSFLEDGICLGYGGLVHINWNDKNAELSFIMNTSLEKKRFHEIWTAYLKLIEKVAFDELELHKVFVYAFDLRPHLYDVLEFSNYFKDATLKEHCLHSNEYVDVVIHSKIIDR